MDRLKGEGSPKWIGLSNNGADVDGPDCSGLLTSDWLLELGLHITFGFEFGFEF